MNAWLAATCAYVALALLLLLRLFAGNARRRRRRRMRQASVRSLAGELERAGRSEGLEKCGSLAEPEHLAARLWAGWEGDGEVGEILDRHARLVHRAFGDAGMRLLRRWTDHPHDSLALAALEGLAMDPDRNLADIVRTLQSRPYLLQPEHRAKLLPVKAALGDRWFEIACHLLRDARGRAWKLGWEEVRESFHAALPPEILRRGIVLLADDFPPGLTRGGVYDPEFIELSVPVLESLGVPEVLPLLRRAATMPALVHLLTPCGELSGHAEPVDGVAQAAEAHARLLGRLGHATEVRRSRPPSGGSGGRFPDVRAGVRS